MSANSRSSGRGPTTAPPAYEWRPWSYADPTANPQTGSDYRQETAVPFNDRTPLLPSQSSGNGATKQKSQWSVFVALFFAFLLSMALISEWKPWSTEDALDPAKRDRIRREWDKELGGHEDIRWAWDEELRGHDLVRSAWSREVKKHEAIRMGWEEERQQLIGMREQLVRDKEDWLREREEETQQLIDMREQLVRDKEDWVRGREEETRREEKRKHDELDRVRAGFSWDELRPDQRCLRRGARQYSARISNVPREYDPVQACTETTVEIHDVKMPSPTHCEDRGCNGVIGHWTVDFSEPTCTTHFDWFKDKGCSSEGSGHRRIESPLQNLQGGDDWRDMCSTTPADFRQLHFDSPDMCENWGVHGVWGIWLIEDRGC